ncbi:hypothetical protein Tco_0820603 [Tanacetum coccineum]|uniref:Reverse transcriptase domain-containing protein n=1 Tax=Tanacetum coccineum TaxID=301880 RepID=A0ABQ5ABK3_9ASTR
MDAGLPIGIFSVSLEDHGRNSMVSKEWGVLRLGLSPLQNRDPREPHPSPLNAHRVKPFSLNPTPHFVLLEALTSSDTKGSHPGNPCASNQGVFDPRAKIRGLEAKSSKEITPDLPTEEPDNSLCMGDEHLSTILETKSDKLIKSSVENLVPILRESEDISITSPKIDFLLEEFGGELDLIDLILPGIDEDNFNEEEGAIDIDILQIEDEILREKLLNVNLLIDKIEALTLTPSIPFVLKYPTSSHIPVVDSDFIIEEVDTFLVSEALIPPGIQSDFDSEGDIIFLDDLLNDDPIPEYKRGGEIVFSQNVEEDDSFTFVIRTFLPFLTYPEDSPLLLSTGSEDTIFDPGIST